MCHARDLRQCRRSRAAAARPIAGCGFSCLDRRRRRCWYRCCRSEQCALAAHGHADCVVRRGLECSLPRPAVPKPLQLPSQSVLATGVDSSSAAPRASPCALGGFPWAPSFPTFAAPGPARAQVAGAGAHLPAHTQGRPSPPAPPFGTAVRPADSQPLHRAAWLRFPGAHAAPAGSPPAALGSRVTRDRCSTTPSQRRNLAAAAEFASESARLTPGIPRMHATDASTAWCVLWGAPTPHNCPEKSAQSTRGKCSQSLRTRTPDRRKQAWRPAARLRQPASGSW